VPLAIFSLALLWQCGVGALEPKDYCVDVACTAQTSPPALTLTWPQVGFARQYFVRRRSNREFDWGPPIATLAGDSAGYSDSAVTPGVEYEYEIQMELTAVGYEGSFINAYSYLAAGIGVPVPDYRGKVLVLLDSSVAQGIARALATFQQDLAGGGWDPILRQVDRMQAVTDVKRLIRSEYNSDPANLKAIILVGHVPVPYSGNIAPDFHESHRGAWPADVFYADMSEGWTDSLVSVTTEDSPLNDNIPGDGKFDQSEIPSPIRLQLGRIDFANLPSFAPRSEVDLLNTYFQKNHAFRFRLFTAPRRAILHDNFGDIDGDAPAVDGWRHFSSFFGRWQVHEVGPESLLPTLSNESYMWAYGCGGGSFTKADGVGDTSTFAANDPKAVFWILHGSYFGDWNSEDNFLRAAIATPKFSLAAIWSGVPHWYLHHLALGHTLGYSTVLSQNNRTAYKSYRNFYPGGVHIALLGDPTLEMFPVLPPGGLSATVLGEETLLNWQPSAESNIIGYKVFHSAAPLGPFELLTPTPVTSNSYATPTLAGTHYYMVRAVKLEQTGSGSFIHASQGVFVSAEGVREFVDAITLEQGNTVVLHIRGAPQRRFQVLRSTDATQWSVTSEGISDAGGKAEYRETEDGARFKLYRVYWP
jgi:hypothetical protein